MTLKSKQFLYGISILIGMIIGVGIFGVPYAIAKAGWVLGVFYFILISSVLLLTHLFYGEVVLRTRENHRFVGFAEKYLGKKYGKPLGVLSNVLGFYGALVAYIIVGGEFLRMLVSPFIGGDLFVYQSIFFVLMAVSVLIGIKLVANLEMAMSVLIILMMVLLPVILVKHFSAGNFISFDKLYLFLPYGVILFALGGSAAIPEIRDILKEDGKEMKKIIIWGSLVPFVLTVLFAFAVVAAVGSGTTEESIRGLQNVLGSWIIIPGAIFGILAIATSFLVLGINLKEMFVLDLKFGKLISWLLAVAVPFLIFALGSRSFIEVIAFTGSLLGGFAGILIVLMYLKAKKMGDRAPEYDLKIPKFLAYLVMGVYVLGIAYEIIYLWK